MPALSPNLPGHPNPPSCFALRYPLPQCGRLHAARTSERWVRVLFFHDAEEVLDLVDHAAHRRRVFEGALAMPLVEAQALQRRFLIMAAADRAAHLDHGHGFLFCTALCHYAGSRAAVSLSRRPRMSPTFLPRRAATARGELMRASAAKVALIMLCGFELPIDLATTSCTPSASKIARIGPPAMMPVPGLAARMITLPAPNESAMS